MSGICVILEQRGGAVKRASVEALAEALRQKDAAGGPVSAVLIGHHLSSFRKGSRAVLQGFVELH